MAGRIAGITIEIGGDTSNLQKSLKGVDSQLKQTQNQLRDVNKLLKLNPGNTELLRQKQKALTEAIGKTKERLEQLKAAQSQMQKGSAEWDALQREIIATEQDLKKLEAEQRAFGNVTAQVLKAAGAKMQEFGGKVEEAGRKMRGISTAAAGALGGLVGLGYKAVQNADDLNTMAKQTGFTTEELQKMQYAADLVDVSLEDITGAARKMKSKMDPANETFKQLGVSVTDADGNLRDANEVFYEAVAALSGIENETERDQVAMELFGKSADSLAGIIDDGGAALKEYGDQAEELGLIMSQDTLDALNETNDTIDQLKANLGGTLAIIGADVASILAPALEKAATAIAKVTEKIRNMNPQQKALIMEILGVVAAIAPALIIGGKIIKIIGSAVSVIGTVVGVLGGPLTIAIAAIIAAGVLLYKNWDTIKAKAQEIWQSVTDWFSQLGENVRNIWQNIQNAISTRIDTAKTKVQNTVNNIKTAVSNAFNNIKTTAQTVWNGIRDAITSPIETAKSKLQGIVDGIAEIFNGLKDAIKLPSIETKTYTIGGKTFEAPGIVWNARAMKNPVLLDGATIFGAMGGRFYGGGEAGREVILSYDKLAQMVGGGSSTTNINVVVNASSGMDERQLADMVARRIQQSVNNRRAVWA